MDIGQAFGKGFCDQLEKEGYAILPLKTMVELRVRYDAYANAVVEDVVGDTTGTLERRDEALELLLEGVRTALADEVGHDKPRSVKEATT